MTKPKCAACLSEDVAYRMGKNGKPYLIDTKRPHFCAKRSKKAKRTGAIQSKEPVPSERTGDVVAGLVGLGYKVREAQEMVGRVPAEVIAAGDVAQIVTEALKRKE